MNGGGIRDDMYVTPEILQADVAEAVRRLNYWMNRHFAEKGLSKAELARLSGLTPQGLTYMMSGEREPRVRSLCAIARALDIDVQALLAPIPGTDGEEPASSSSE